MDEGERVGVMNAKIRRARALQFGWVWGPVEIVRLSIIKRSNGTYHILCVNDLEIYVSPTGRTTRVFRGRKELKSNATKEREPTGTTTSDRAG
jgi:hypothetical protein